MVNSIPKDKEIIFAPDKNLGKYIISQTGRDMLLWDGACVVHEAFSLEKLVKLQGQYPESQIIAHPESEEQIIKLATYVGSTSGMINHVEQNPNGQYIVATEAGILHKMQQRVPASILIPAPAKENNTCACSECGYMKLNTLEKLYSCLLNEDPEIIINKDLQEKALRPIERMLELSK